MLSELKMTKEEFIDLCILCGCDYTETIEGKKNFGSGYIGKNRSGASNSI